MLDLGIIVSILSVWLQESEMGDIIFLQKTL